MPKDEVGGFPIVTRTRRGGDIVGQPNNSATCYPRRNILPANFVTEIRDWATKALTETGERHLKGGMI